MKKDAEAHSAEDEKKKRLIDSRNMADQMIYTAEKALADHKDKVPEEVKTGVEAKVKTLKDAKEKDDADAITTATTALSQEMSKIGEAVAKAAQASGQSSNGAQTGQAESSETGNQGGTAPNQQGGENVRDADVEGGEKKD